MRYIVEIRNAQGETSAKRTWTRWGANRIVRRSHEAGLLRWSLRYRAYEMLGPDGKPL